MLNRVLPTKLRSDVAMPEDSSAGTIPRVCEPVSATALSGQSVCHKQRIAIGCDVGEKGGAALII
jgi:hypothetical protein